MKARIVRTNYTNGFNVEVMGCGNDKWVGHERWMKISSHGSKATAQQLIDCMVSVSDGRAYQVEDIIHPESST